MVRLPAGLAKHPRWRTVRRAPLRAAVGAPGWRAWRRRASRSAPGPTPAAAAWRRRVWVAAHHWTVWAAVVAYWAAQGTVPTRATYLAVVPFWAARRQVIRQLANLAAFRGFKLRGEGLSTVLVEDAVGNLTLERCHSLLQSRVFLVVRERRVTCRKRRAYPDPRGLESLRSNWRACRK